MDDEDILTRIKTLVEEERGLAEDPEAPVDKRGRRRRLEEQLDQCWDLLRQRQARREFAQDPDSARERPAQQVEGYLQ